MNFRTAIAVFLCVILAEPCGAAFFEQYPTGATKDAKEAPAAQIEVDKLPDILQPFPETEKERKKREKKELKEAKQYSGNNLYKRKKKQKFTYDEVKRKNTAPKTLEEYYKMSRDKKREELDFPSAKVKPDEKLEPLPAPGLRLVKYNDPPGSHEPDTTMLTKNKIARSQGILSPDGQRIVYTEIYLYPTTMQAASSLRVYAAVKGSTNIEKLKYANTALAFGKPLISVGTDRLYKYERRVLVPLDWSEDGTKFAVKEKKGSIEGQTWQTDIHVYDFNTGKAIKLSALREAIRYYWKTQKDIDLIDNLWDIYPLGWSVQNPDRLVSYAYVYDKNNGTPKFLGTWSIDYKNESPVLESLTETNFEISTNGMILKFKKE